MKMNDSLMENKAEGNVDKIIKKRFFPEDGPGRIFVDVGAAMPDCLSISALYRRIGWRIIAIEPNPAFCKLYKEKGYEVLQYACGERNEDNVEFFVVDSHGSEYENVQVSYESFSSLGIRGSYLESFKNAPKRDTEKIKVNLRRLDTILETHAPDIDHIDILSVDVEGWELEVLNGLDIPKYRPRVVVIENLFNEKKYISYMKGIDYILWKCIWPNDIYVSREVIRGTIRRFFYSLRAYIYVSREVIRGTIRRFFYSLRALLFSIGRK